MTTQQKVAMLYALLLLGAAALNYLPGLTDDQGRVFGIFALDIFDDLLHLASALWAFFAALIGGRAARQFLLIFGGLYLADGLLGLATGSGFLDLGIFNYGVLDQPFKFKVLASGPHILLGGFALSMGLRRW
ncbi:hypothetical protein [Paracoccus pacificus]|uniref:DUF4383 domain-containing protein n=1 Tax=Paracoccus pacificus TaxID=1463598 RepID=A0ABW4R352_9RHOB